jgi:hypothetical protein
MADFTGQLRSNEIFSALFNMIISQQVFADNIAGTFSSLVDKARVDGGLFGDTKLFYSTDVLKSAPWGNDAEATNLLALHRPASPEVQAIFLDQFRQISLTVDNYLTKRAWGTADAFSQFNSVMKGWIRDTKKVYDAGLYNSFIGTAVGSEGKQTITVPVVAALGDTDGEEALRIEGMVIAQAMADLLIDLRDFSRDFNDYGVLRSYANEGIQVVWNAKHANKIKKMDLPTIFHKDGLIDKFEQEVLPSRYFGTVITLGNIASFSDATPEPGKPLNSGTNEYTPGTGNVNGTVRSLVERTITLGEDDFHVFPGDEIPADSTVADDVGDFETGEVYIEDSNIIAKVMVKLPPFMSAFEVGTSFYNPKSLTENHYLTWGHNTLNYLKNYPMIKILRG